MPCTMLAFLQNKLLSRYALIPCLIVIALVLYNDEQLFNMLDVDGSLFSGMRDRQVVHEEIDSFCCPRVFIYNSREIEERASAIVGQDMKLTDLDPMNTLNDLSKFLHVAPIVPIVPIVSIVHIVHIVHIAPIVV